MESGRPHETLIPNDCYAATLVIVSNPRIKRASIYSTRPLPTANYVRPRLDDTVRDDLLDELVKRIEDA